MHNQEGVNANIKIKAKALSLKDTVAQAMPINLLLEMAEKAYLQGFLEKIDRHGFIIAQNPVERKFAKPGICSLDFVQKVECIARAF